MGITRDDKIAEIDRNLAAFLRLWPLLATTHPGEYVLLRQEQIVGFYPGPLEAQEAGEEQFPDELFSFQSVDNEPIDLRIFSRAVDLWST